MRQQNGTVVLIHSSASSGRQWRSLSERLSDRYNVIAPDLSGYGPSDGDPGEYTFDDDCRLVRETIETVQGPVHLIGHSYGGLLSAKVALERPDILHSLTLIEPVCFHLLNEAGESEAYAEIKGVSDSQKIAADSGDLLGSAEGFVTYWMGVNAWKSMPDERRCMVASIMPKVAMEWAGGFERTTCLAEYASFPLKTLLVRADDTTLAARRVIDLLLEQVRKREFVEIGYGGHMSPVTNSEPVNVAIDQFLGAL